MTRTLAVVAFLTAGLALGQNVPGSITFNARLTDTGGAPVTGSHALGFGLYDQASGGAAVWTENVSGASFSTEGVAFAELGAVTPLTASALDGRKLYLEVSVDGTTMAPRLAIVSVPYAIRASVAGTAASVGSLTEAAIQKRVTGTCSAGQAVRSIDASGSVTCETMPAGLASCAAGEVLKSNGTSWICAADAAGPSYGVTAPLALAGTTLSLSGCPNNQVLKSNGTTWICADDLQGGTVTNVSVTAPLVVANPTTTPALSITQAGSASPGYLSAADWNTFNAKRTTGGRNLIEWLPVLANWTNLTGGTPPNITLSAAAADVREGGSAFQFDRSTAGSSGAVYGGLIAIDPSRRHEGRIWARMSAGAGGFYAGVRCFDAAGTSLGDRFFLVNNLVLPAAMTLYVASIQGEGAAQSQFFPGTRFLQPIIYTNNANVGVTSVDGFEIYNVPNRPDVVQYLADIRNTSATYVDVAGRTLVFTKTDSASRARVTYFDSFGFLMTGTQSIACTWRITVDGVQQGREQWYHSSTATGWRIWSGDQVWLLNGIPAGTHTVQVQVAMSVGASQCLNGWAGGSQENFLMVEEL